MLNKGELKIDSTVFGVSWPKTHFDPWDIYNWHFDWVSMYFDNFIFECWALATTLMIPLPKTLFLSEIGSSTLFWDFLDSIPYYQDKSGIPISEVTWFYYLIWQKKGTNGLQCPIFKKFLCLFKDRTKIK